MVDEDAARGAPTDSAHAREEVWRIADASTGPQRIGDLEMVASGGPLRAQLRRVTIDGVRLSALVASPHRARFVTAARPTAMLMLVQSGRVITHAGIEVGAGSLVATTPGPVTAYEAPTAVRSAVIVLCGSLTPPHLVAPGRTVVVPPQQHSPVMSALVDLLAPLAAGPLHADGAAAALGHGLTALTLAVLTELAPPHHGADAVRFSAQQYIEQHLGDQELDPAAVAAAVGVSQRSLHAVFREAGTSVARSIRERRLELAALALRDPAQAAGTAELAARVGFAGPDQFARAFRARFGRAPGAYRDEERRTA